MSTCKSVSPYYYPPNILVTCNPQNLTTRKRLRYPRLIIEVLAPGAETQDRGEKLSIDFSCAIALLYENVTFEEKK